MKGPERDIEGQTDRTALLRLEQNQFGIRYVPSLTKSSSSCLARLYFQLFQRKLAGRRSADNVTWKGPLTRFLKKKKQIRIPIVFLLKVFMICSKIMAR